jgi:DNA-binding response OmpR family regulator
MRLLVIEDEPRMLELLEQGLREEGHDVLTARDGADGLSLAETGEFDAILLDVMLPKVDGIEVARRLRKSGSRVPVLMLTARDAEEDIRNGLDTGADDYLTKPFSFVELLARLRAVTRRTSHVRSSTIEIDDLVLDTAQHQASRGGRDLKLTRTEFDLLERLLHHMGDPVPRERLIAGVWGFDRDIESNTLDAFIRLLRQKVDQPGKRRLIHTVRGIGYCARVGDLLPEEGYS